MNKSQIVNTCCKCSIQLCGDDGWQLQQIMPTERYFIVFSQESGLDYVMADAIILFSKVVGERMQFKSVGLNYSMASDYDEYWLEETEYQSIFDRLSMVILEDMIQYMMTAEHCTREKAILRIKSDFQRSKVNVDSDIQLLFNEVE